MAIHIIPSEKMYFKNIITNEKSNSKALFLVAKCISKTHLIFLELIAGGQIHPIYFPKYIFTLGIKVCSASNIVHSFVHNAQKSAWDSYET